MCVEDTVPALSTVSTVSESVAVPVPPIESVTVNVTVYDPAVPDPGVHENDDNVELHPDGSPLHPYVYPVPDPPDAPFVDSVVASLTSTGFFDADNVPALTAV